MKRLFHYNPYLPPLESGDDATSRNKWLEHRHEIHRAKYLLVEPDRIIENGFLRVIDGRIVEVGAVGRSLPDRSDRMVGTARVKDHGDGCIVPSLVNAHTHFELSALHGQIPFEGGFNHWVRALIAARDECSVALLKEKAKQAMAASFDAGTALAAEISTLGITAPLLKRSSLTGVCFQEYLGENRPIAFPVKTKAYSSSESISKSGSIPEDVAMGYSVAGMRCSVAGHAPHTTSPQLLQSLKRWSRQHHLPFSIHVAESDDETEFISTGRGSWADFMTERGIDTSAWPFPARSPIQYLYDAGVLDAGTLIVHLINVDDQDLDIVAGTGAVAVVCPRSNMNLHGSVPDLPKMIKSLGRVGDGSRGRPSRIALGTDSLASAESLDLFDEMRWIMDRFPEIRPSEILNMATCNGARALGFGNVAGTLEVGKMARFLYIPLTRHHNPSLSPSKFQSLIIDLMT